MSSMSSQSLYFNDFKNCFIYSKEEQETLFIQCKDGDKDALEKLIKCYQPLVISLAEKYLNEFGNFDLLDLIQEGNIELLKIIPRFDSSKASFFTYATYSVTGAILRYISKNTCYKNLSSKAKQYLKLCEEYKENGSFTSDSFFCDLLEINEKKLSSIKMEVSRLQSEYSLNKKILDDEDGEFEELVVLEDSSYNDALIELDTRNLLLVLKEVLSPRDFYLMYHQYFSDTKTTFSKIAHYFQVKDCYLFALRKSFLEEVKQYIGEDKTKYIQVMKKLEDNYGDLNLLNPYPIFPTDILKYLYLKDDFTELERKLYFLRYVEKNSYSLSHLSIILQVSLEELNHLLQILEEKEKSKMNGSFEEFQSKQLSRYHLSLFDIYLNEKYSFSPSVDEMKLFSSKKQFLLQKYFQVPQKTSMTLEELEARVNHELFGLPISSYSYLYSTFMEHKNRYNKEQQLFIETYLFGMREKEDFKKIYPTSSCLKSKMWFVQDLEKLKFSLPSFLDNSFTKEKYISIRNHPNLDSKEREVLDCYFDIVSYPKEENFDFLVANAKQKAKNIYIGKSLKRNVLNDVYLSYLNHPIFPIEEETRQILISYFQDSLSYEDILKKFPDCKLTTTELSDFIYDWIRKIDLYRFSILLPTRIDEMQLKLFFQVEEKRFTKKEQEILYLKYIKLLDNDEIILKEKIDKKKMNQLVKKFNLYFPKFLIRDVSLTEEDILEELNKHPSESIVSFSDQKYLSFFYGIETSFNPSKEKLKQSEIARRFEVSSDVVHSRISKNIENLKLKKVNLLRKDLCFIPRKDLEKYLSDVHIPLTDFEKELICYLFSFQGYPFKTLEELERIFNDSSKNLRRKYYNAMVKIFKYQNKEIDGILNFEVDVQPNLKYFCKSQQIFLIEFYKNKISKKDIACKYHVSYDSVKNTFDFLEFYLHELIHNHDTSKFNFDIVKEVMESPNFPFMGDKDIAYQIFELYFGQNSFVRLSPQKIANQLKIYYSEEWIMDTLTSFMLSVKKYEFQKNSDTQEYVSFSMMSIEDVISFLRSKKARKLPLSLREAILSFYSLSGRHVMFPKDKKKVFELLDSLEVMRRNENGFYRVLK